jgi:hypothetical protein
MLDVEQTAEARPQGRRELGPPVQCDGGRNSKPGYPTSEEGPGAVGGGNGREGNGLRPPRGLDDYCEQVSMAAEGQQRADQVDVDVRETAVRNRYLCCCRWTCL